MKAIRPLTLELHIFYLRWALSEMHPMHPDVPRNVLRLRGLLAERDNLPPNVIRRVYAWL
jgi:hypothetical protein